MKQKILRFNLSRNSLHKSEPKIIIEDTGMCLENYHTEEEYNKAEEYFFEHQSTLRDICVLLYEGCGQGVQWQFSRELALKLNIDKKDVQIALNDIVSNYAKLSEHEAMEKYNSLASYIE